MPLAGVLLRTDNRPLMEIAIPHTVSSLLLLATLAMSMEPRQRPLLSYVDDLFSDDASIRASARDVLIERNDAGIAAALVESLFFNQAGRAETAAVLEHILGEKHGMAFKKWIETIGRREDIVAAPGYVGFKARLMSKIDPALAAFLREDAPRSIRVEEIVWGGVKKDGIPALDRPPFIEAKRALWMADGEQVFGVRIGGEARAYPERILAWHEMANDVIAGRAVSLSYCTLCGAAVLYDGRASDGRTYTFGSSGFLYRSNKLMYDRQTQTLWSQLTGEPVLGPLVSRGLDPLRVLPLSVTTWGEWRAAHPETLVLSLETGHERDYRSGAAYGKYFASPDTMFPVWKKAPSTLRVKDWVLVVNTGEARKIFPLDALRREALTHDRVGGHDVVLLGERVWFSNGRRFRLADGGALEDERSGERFSISEEALISPSGVRLDRVPAHRAFWFGAWTFYPDAELWDPGEAGE